MSRYFLRCSSLLSYCQKSIVIFEINTLKFVKKQSFMLKKKIKLGPKLPNLGISGLKFEKKLLLDLKSAPSNLSEMNF